MTVDVLDVGKYISEKLGPMESRKLQKLVYYSQAWSLTWDGRELFPESIEAWVDGPVVSRLYSAHHRQWQVDRLPKGNAEKLSDADRATVDAVLDFYSHLPWAQLIELTHGEAPWIDARGDTPRHLRCDAEISSRSMRSFYTRKSMTSSDVPTRVSQPAVDASPESVDDAVSELSTTWQSVLDRLADR